MKYIPLFILFFSCHHITVKPAQPVIIDCSQHLPEFYKLMYNPDLKQYIIWTGKDAVVRDQESLTPTCCDIIDIYFGEKSLSYDLHMWYLGSNNDRWMSLEVPLGEATRFKDSCTAKDSINHWLLHKREKSTQDSIIHIRDSVNAHRQDSINHNFKPI